MYNYHTLTVKINIWHFKNNFYFIHCCKLQCCTNFVLNCIYVDVYVFINKLFNTLYNKFEIQNDQFSFFLKNLEKIILT